MRDPEKNLLFKQNHTSNKTNINKSDIISTQTKYIEIAQKLQPCTSKPTTSNNRANKFQKTKKQKKKYKKKNTCG